MGPGRPAKECENEELVFEFENACRGGDYEFAPEYREELLQRLTATPRPIDEWHEDDGTVLWWSFPIEEPPYCGSPLDADWPGYHTHWTSLIVPDNPKGQT
ncbi:hypothetical protein PC41400_21670 [Paenibacillus chitinolyticus]|uniref:Uncharacterized protein n=1 Tax=Paenibacillus chitinolyticus TaxID=79263 RepID=A0A410X0X8_9BACL|nr:hypothetical protein [Paenibacillus chitinolyticus]MCY9593742.1 hypothetical protein [Paenibacillus chitinolyticus]MCY9599693.1 hypothetical protein [Paenibacillus chitinolyticus]QAV20131.1 hypothetical protein PC41400_21670 [Paenibacillus chitinolyticus]